MQRKKQGHFWDLWRLRNRLMRPNFDFRHRFHLIHKFRSTDWTYLKEYILLFKAKQWKKKWNRKLKVDLHYLVRNAPGFLKLSFSLYNKRSSTSIIFRLIKHSIQDEQIIRSCYIQWLLAHIKFNLFDFTPVSYKKNQ